MISVGERLPEPEKTRDELSATSDTDLLNFMIDKGIIDYERVQMQFAMAERYELLKEHPYKIWQGENGKWYTYLPDEKKGRVLKKRTTQKAIEDIVVQYIREHKEIPYIRTVFTEWVNQKLEYKEIRKQSYDRYCTDFERFFSKAEISVKRFKDITEEDLEDFIKTSIRDFNLTVKTFSGLRLLLNGIFKYGKKKKYTDISITQFFGDLELPKTIFAKKVKTKQDEIFFEDEIPCIASYVKSNPTIWNLGVLLVFVTGMRVGELSALKREDIDGHIIHIRRTEIKYKDTDTNKWVVGIEEFAKTDAGNRDLLITDTAVWILNEIMKLNPHGEFLFMNNGKRIRENTFNKRITSICEELHLHHRSIHKARKTYGTTLIDADVDDSIVAEQMGHADITTTKKYYYYSNKTEKRKREQIEKALAI